MSFASSTKSVLSGDYQSLAGSPLLVDGRSRSHSPLRARSAISLLGMHPLDIALDGTNLFICGMFQNQSLQQFALLYKLDLMTDTIVDSFAYPTPHGESYFMGVTVDSDNVYVGGRVFHENILKAGTFCLDKNNLSSVKWSDLRFYTVSPQIRNNVTHLCADATHLYVVGVYAIPHGQQAFRVKLVKTTGEFVWGTSGISTDYCHLVDGGTYIDITGSAGGTRFIHRVDKVANTHSESSNYNPILYNHFKIALFQGNYYIAGTADYPPHDSLIACFNASTRAQNWAWRYNISSNPEHVRGIVVNSQGVYGLGAFQITSGGPIRSVLIRLTHGGSLQWIVMHPTPTIGSYWGIVTHGDSLLIATYDNPSGVPLKDCYGYIERRSLYTGELLPL